MVELIGAIIGDGNIYNKRPSYVEICGHSVSDKAYLTKYLASIVSTEIGYVPKPFFHGGAIRIRINNKEFVNWLISLGLPAGALKCYSVEIPSICFRSDKLLKRCVRGIFDTDGFIYWDMRKIYSKPYPRIRLTTCSENLFKQLVGIFTRFGFDLYTKFNPRRGSYDIELYGHEQLDKWKSLIGTSN